MNLRNIAVVLSANTTSFRSQMAMAAKDVDTFDKKVSGSGGGLAKFGQVAGVAAKAGVLAFGVALIASTAAAMQFETRMRNVNSISHLSEQAFREQNAAVLDMSKAFPQSANTLAEGLYDIASSGFQAADGLMVLESSAMAASAGMTDTATSAKAITAVLNAYGLEAEEADRVGNVLFQGVNVGVMSFEELAGSIGDTVGMAAAAGVNIEDLTAGIATMTLSGISAAEASTSMNRTIQALIQPSDSLAATINALGYESGVSMLNTLGLHGTMEKLRTVTGGNIEVLLRYFPEIRAARGALALMSAEGENYKKTQEAMNEAQDNGGAMLKTFQEQMKGTGAQFTLLKNNATAWGIQLGTVVLPYIQDFGDQIRKAAAWVGDLADEGERRLRPFLENLRPILENWREIWWDIHEPIVQVGGAIAAIALAGLIEALNVLSTVLVSTTGFLADHKEILAGLAAFYGVGLAAQILVTGGAFDVLAIKAYSAASAMVLSTVIPALQSVSAVAYAVSAAFATQGIAGAAATASTAIMGMVNPMVLLGVAAAALAATWVVIQQTNNKLRAEGQGWVADWASGIDSSSASLGEMNDAFSQARIGVMEYEDELSKLHQDTSAAEKMSDVFFEEGANIKSARDELAKHRDMYSGFLKVVEQVATELGISQEEALEAIREQGIAVQSVGDDVENAEAKQRKAVEKTVEARKKATAETLWELGKVKASQSDMARLSGLSAEEFAAQAEALHATALAAEEFGKKVGEAWASQQDVVSALGDSVDATGQDILNWYDMMVTDGQKFSENIRTAIELGYDPGLIARMLEAGPAQAGPLLQEMVTSHKDGLVEQVNEGERALTELNLHAVEIGRLTNLAMKSSTDTLAKDLKTAMAITTIIMAGGGKTTMKALTDQLQMGEAEVSRIADSYGISLAAALDPVRAATGLGPIPRGRRPSQPYNANAEGGYIDPGVWGDTNADSVPSWLMPGEVVIKKKAVEKWGVDPLLKLNEGEMPFDFAGGGAYAAGGLVAPPNYPAGHFGDTSEAASAQTYMKAMAMWLASQGAGGGFSRAGGGGPAGRYTAGMLDARADILNAFGPMSVGGYANRNIAGTNQRSAHGMWRAWDFMVGMNNVAKGDSIARYLSDHASLYGLKGMIWNARSNFGGGWKPYKHPGASGATAQHLDHVHAEFFRQGGLVPYGKYDQGGYLPPGLSIASNQTGSPERVLGPRDVMPQIMVNVNVYIGNEQLRGTIRQEISIDRDQQTRRTRSMADA